MAMIGIGEYFFRKDFAAFALAVLQAITTALQLFFIKYCTISQQRFLISSSVLSPYGLFLESL